MVSAAIVCAPKDLKISLVRTPFFIRPDLGRASTGELWSDMLRCYEKKNPKKFADTCDDTPVASDALVDLGSDLSLRGTAKPKRATDGLQEHANQSDIDAGIVRFNAGMNVLPDGLAPITFDFDVEMTSSLAPSLAASAATASEPRGRRRLARRSSSTRA